jgi:hypothetical protein
MPFDDAGPAAGNDPSGREGEKESLIRSFFGTCKLNGIDPRAWLLHVLTHIRSTPSEEYHKLLPQTIDPSLLS